ncbi:hypothetical protein [Photobacterium galatheae]|uniref:Uncharacterized protein n=1 Tax=Photobacterium galatheae TaxID=1654360 RepID=A0A066RKE2_9GAMM|nr:hypothetical protein [Photobacterium galatheae]KDM90920.1 hypothetical protein EA58_14265 [Photobacterium galatheae]MCM0149116.1 hypothetical protein [Photobacterium galatheae]
MKQKLILSKKKRRTARRPLLLLTIVAFVVIGGGMTVVQEVLMSTDSRVNCQSSVCERQVVFNLGTTETTNPESQEELLKESDETRSIERLQNVELENDRLLLQRDLQRFISDNVTSKPFNYKQSDFCILGLSTNAKKIVTETCSNYVFKRTIDLALEDKNIQILATKYDFKQESPTFEVRLKF